MGACSIDISQYRSRIGTFAGTKSPCINKASFGNKLKTNTILESFIILSYLLVLSNVTQKLLIISGLELNPGPSFPLDKITSANKRDANEQVRTVADHVEKRQDVSVGASNFAPTVTSTVPQPRIDAADRRHIEAQNEDKAHTTKDTLDDIKRVHQKEKKKKEEHDNVPYQTRTANEGGSTVGASGRNSDTYAWDPKYAMSLKNAEKKKDPFGASLASLNERTDGQKEKNVSPTRNAQTKLSSRQKTMGLTATSTRKSSEGKPTSAATQISVEQDGKELAPAAASKADSEIKSSPNHTTRTTPKEPEPTKTPKKQTTTPTRKGQLRMTTPKGYSSMTTTKGKLTRIAPDNQATVPPPKDEILMNTPKDQGEPTNVKEQIDGTIKKYHTTPTIKNESTKEVIPTEQTKISSPESLVSTSTATSKYRNTSNTTPKNTTSNTGTDGHNTTTSHIDTHKPTNSSPYNLRSKINMTKVLPSPDKASNDKKEYRSLLLSNGLRVLLISDTTYDLEKLDLEENAGCEEETSDEENSDEEETSDEERGSESDSEDEANEDLPRTSSKSTSGLKKSAAGLCVGMGSFSDPAELPGLAHFLEHMVFMGSEKYPDENAFDEFIQKHGGFDNAHTECEHTTFYFEIQRKHLREALDRFAQFFTAPLMKKDAMQREREAVDSEFQMSLPSDSCRKEQIFGSLARPDHPMAKFMWGNLSSLQMAKLDDDDFHKRLHAFFLRHYTAQSMTLTVQSQETLDNLEKLVIELFASIPNNQKIKETFDHLTEPFKTNLPKFSRLYKIAPIQNIFQVDINWALPPLLHEFKSKPIHYLSTIIGHEGKGSLISFLRRNVWALQLNAGNALDGFELNTTYSKFSINLILTQEGYENIDKVLVAVFSYLKMLKKCGPSSRIFEEIHKVDRLDFEFGQQPTAVENVEKLCESMQLYPPALYLTGGDLIFEFDSKLVDDITHRLNEDEANIFITSKQYQDIAVKTEPWFKTKYIDEDIPKEWTEAWKRTEIFPEFHLPLPNIFIAENLSLLSKTSNKDEDRNKYPKKIKHDESGELFYRLDDVFEKPRAIAIFSLRSSLARQSVENAVCLDLLVSCLGQIMITDTYAADQALLEHTVNVGDRGEITIKINGLNDKLILLLKTILTHLSELSSNPELCAVFDAVRDQTKKNYYNFFIVPSKLARNVRLSVLQDVHWTAMEKHTAISGITIEMVKKFTKTFLQSSNIFVQGLVQGNVAEDEAIRMHNLVSEALTGHKKLANRNGVTNIRCNEVPNGNHFLRVNGINPKDTNTIITNYYQSAHKSSLENHMMMEIALVLMQEPVFDILRTKEQLGYAVFSVLRNTYGILGISITVNSQATKFTADHVNERIESFLSWFVEEKLTDLQDSEFHHYVETIIKAKKEADVSLSEEVDRNWAEIASDEYLFDRQAKMIKLLENCEKKRMVEHVKSIIDPKQTRKKLSVQVLGNPDGIKIQTETEDENKTEEGEPSQVSCDLDPDSVFDLKYLKSEDHTLSSQFIMNSKSFKEGLKTYDVTHIVE